MKISDTEKLPIPMLDSLVPKIDVATTSGIAFSNARNVTENYWLFLFLFVRLIFHSFLHFNDRPSERMWKKVQTLLFLDSISNACWDRVICSFRSRCRNLRYLLLVDNFFWWNMDRSSSLRSTLASPLTFCRRIFSFGTCFSRGERKTFW